MRAAETIFQLSVVAVVLCCTSLATAQIHWQSDLQRAQQMAAQTNRLVLIHFGADWCAPCRKLEQTVFAEPGIGQALDANFVLVKLNADYNKALMRQYNVSGIPADVIITPEGRVVQKVRSPATAVAYVSQMNLAAQSVRVAQSGSLASGSPSPVTAPSFPKPSAPSSSFTPPARWASDSRNNWSSPGSTNQNLATTNRNHRADPRFSSQHGSAAPQSPWNQNTPAKSSPPQGGSVAPRWSDVGRSQTPLGSGAVAPANPWNRGGTTSPTGPVNPRDTASTNHRAIENLSTPAPVRQQQQPPYANRFDKSPSPSVRSAPPATAINNPPLALEGHCPVTLQKQQQLPPQQRKWVPGDKRWGAIHEGRTYLFVGPTEQRAFLEDPQRYAPVMSGFDPVLAIDRQQQIPGRREFGVYFGGKIYLFAEEGTLQHFSKNPARYTAARPRTAQRNR